MPRASPLTTHKLCSAKTSANFRAMDFPYVPALRVPTIAMRGISTRGAPRRYIAKGGHGISFKSVGNSASVSSTSSTPDETRDCHNTSGSMSFLVFLKILKVFLFFQ